MGATIRDVCPHCGEEVLMDSSRVVMDLSRMSAEFPCASCDYIIHKRIPRQFFNLLVGEGCMSPVGVTEFNEFLADLRFLGSHDIDSELT